MNYMYYPRTDGQKAMHEPTVQYVEVGSKISPHFGISDPPLELLFNTSTP